MTVVTNDKTDAAPEAAPALSAPPGTLRWRVLAAGALLLEMAGAWLTLRGIPAGFPLLLCGAALLLVALKAIGATAAVRNRAPHTGGAGSPERQALPRTPKPL